MIFFLDTNICIYYLKGTYSDLEENLLSHHPDDIKIPSIVKAELLYGAMKSARKEENLQRIAEFLLPFEIAPFGDEEAIQYGKIRAALEQNGTPIGPNDLIVAATVMSRNGTLVTHNVEEFRRVAEIEVVGWT